MAAERIAVLLEAALKHEEFRAAISIHGDRRARRPLLDPDVLLLRLEQRRHGDAGPAFLADGGDMVQIRDRTARASP